jgi:hypothetical protein
MPMAPGCPVQRSKVSSTAAGESAWLVWLASRPAAPPQFVRRGGIERRIDEHRQAAALEVERVLDLQLEVADDLDARQPLGLEAVRQLGADGIVAAARDCRWRTRRPALSCSVPPQGIEPRPVGVEQLDGQRHLPECVGGAGQAGIEGAHRDLDVVEQALGQGAAVQVAPRPRGSPGSSPRCCGWSRRSGWRAPPGRVH